MEQLLNNSMCRCCSAEGTYKDLKNKYLWMGEEEIYADMLKNCFDVSLALSEDGENGGICEFCITQLRNAVNFKKQVLSTEVQFKRVLEENILKSGVVKIEAPKEDDDDVSDDNGPFGDNDSDSDYRPLLVKNEDDEDEKPLRKRASSSKTPTAKAKKAKLTKGKSKKSSSKTEDGGPSKKRAEDVAPKRKKKKKIESATPERIEHRVNLSAILQYSSASPFRDKGTRGFSCLYCCKYFKNVEDLRAHTSQQQEKDKLNSMIDYKLSYNPIKLDITDLRCTICEHPMKDLNQLKDHLTQVHNKTIYKNIKDIILPFRLEDGNNFTCVVCSVVHISFKSLYQHMSCHYRNYCCKKCGTGYITIAALRKHGKTHEQGNFPCDYCKKTYSSYSKKRNHEKGVHIGGGWLRNKCPHCPEIFVSYYDRKEHLVNVHNENPVFYPCNACNKIYKKKFELNRHIKHHHLQQKSFLCDLCDSKGFFSKRGLLEHLARHKGLDMYNCEICGKVFSRERSLKDHQKQHEDDSKLQCDICKKSFTHKSSLKTHVRLHQDDLDIFKEFDDVRHLIDDRDMTLKQIAEESKKKVAVDDKSDIDLISEIRLTNL